VGGVSPADASGLSIFAAVEAELGLKLESQTGPVHGLVIDHAEQPADVEEQIGMKLQQ
jgi:uncharacterized protein (TIGR03435 family)